MSPHPQPLQPPGSQPGNDSELWGGEEELPTIVRKITMLLVPFLVPRKQESLRHFLVITGRASPSAPGTLKHLCVHFKFLSHVTFIQQLCPVLGVRGNKKLPLLYESADRGRIGYSSVMSVMQRGKDCSGEDKDMCWMCPD